MVCDDLEGWDGRDVRRLRREEVYVYSWLMYVIVQKKLTTL